MKCFSPIISTHTPLAGCDEIPAGQFPRWCHFNSHTPRGVRPAAQDFISKIGNFNSHTPRGVRLALGNNRKMKKRFQLTHPSRGATQRSNFSAAGSLISTHTPLAGCDLKRRVVLGMYGGISTHTPLAGCDPQIPRSLDHGKHFNSHTPRGVRLHAQR